MKTSAVVIGAFVQAVFFNPDMAVNDKIDELKIADNQQRIVSEIRASTPQIRASLNDETIIVTTSANLI